MKHEGKNRMRVSDWSVKIHSHAMQTFTKIHHSLYYPQCDNSVYLVKTEAD